jgi:hypothetical protein
MKRLAFALLTLPLTLPVVACYGGERANSGQCPAGEVCSPATPNGLHFIGRALVDDLLLTGPAPTAVGGTQDVALQYDRGDGILIALDQPWNADDDGGIGVKVDHTSGSIVTVRGAGSRTNYLRIVDAGDGTLFDRKQLTGASIDTIALVPADFESIPVGSELVWATGDQELGIALYGQVQESPGPQSERVVDDSMQASLAGAERTAWDTLHLPSATVGSHAISVTAGDKPTATIDLAVVDHADALVALSPPATIKPNTSTSVCFAANSQSRYIVGLAWSFSIDGQTETHGAGSFDRNCISASTTKTSGTVAIQATAGGQSALVTLAVSATARELPGTPVVTRTGNGRVAATMGDRAAM